MSNKESGAVWDKYPGIKSVWVGDTGRPGPTVGIIGGIHGDEAAGIAVIEARRKLPLQRGRLIAVAGSPEAIRSGRHSKEVNLNRQFRLLTDDEKAHPASLPYEAVRAQELLPVFDQLDALLDLHEFSQPDGIPFIITEPRGFTSARAIGAEIISHGWPKTEAGGTDSYMESLEREGLTYELGYKQYTARNINMGHEVVARFLSIHGLNEQRYKPLAQEVMVVEALRAHIKQTEGFRFTRSYSSFEYLHPNEQIADDGGPVNAGPEGGLIIFPNAGTAVGTEAFSIGRFRTLRNSGSGAVFPAA